MFLPKRRPRPQAPVKNNQPLFASYADETLAFMAAGCGFIAVMTLFIELYTAQVHALALEMPTPFLSLPLGVGTMILAGLTARVNRSYAIPAVMFGVTYWGMFAVGLIA